MYNRQVTLLLENKNHLYKQCRGSEWLGGVLLKHVMGWLLSEIRLEGADIRKACLEGAPTAPGWSSEDLGGVGGVQQVRNLVLGGLERMLSR